MGHGPHVEQTARPGNESRMGRQVRRLGSRHEPDVSDVETSHRILREKKKHDEDIVHKSRRVDDNLQRRVQNTKC